MQSVIIGSNQAGQRLDKFLHKYLPLAGTNFLYKMLRKKNITLNGKKAQGSEILALNDKVCCFFSEETFARFSGQNVAEQERGLSGQNVAEQEMEASISSPAGKASSYGRYGKGHVEEGIKAYDALKGIDVLYEDGNFLILNKPAGILTQKAAPGDVSLNEWITGYLMNTDPCMEETFTAFRPAVCNRLDRNTSGIVLCGKSLAGLQYLSECIRERRIRKFYRTICIGPLKEPVILNGFLYKDSKKNKVSILPEKASVKTAPGGASPVLTSYTPLKTENGYTLLEVELITGKPHQIRAHLASTGHPLIGDTKYGQKQANAVMKDKYGLHCQLLHACRVEFPQADSGPGKNLSGKCITAPCPETFVRIQKALGL